MQHGCESHLVENVLVLKKGFLLVKWNKRNNNLYNIDDKKLAQGHTNIILESTTFWFVKFFIVSFWFDHKFL